MTIYRVKHTKDYTVINNYICTDSRLSWKAKGIWLYAFSRPDDWEFYLCDLINQSTDGEKSVKVGLRELEDAGYLQKSQSKDKSGKFMSYEWVFYEVPQEIKEILPQACFRLAVNQPLLSTDINKKKKEGATPVEEKDRSSSTEEIKQLIKVARKKVPWLTISDLDIASFLMIYPCDFFMNIVDSLAIDMQNGARPRSIKAVLGKKLKEGWTIYNELKNL